MAGWCPGCWQRRRALLAAIIVPCALLLLPARATAQAPPTSLVAQPDPNLGCSLEMVGQSAAGMTLRAHTWNTAGQDVPGAVASWVVYQRTGQSLSGESLPGDSSGSSLFRVAGMSGVPPGGGVGATLTTPAGARCFAVLPDPLPRPAPVSGPPGPAPPTSSCSLARSGSAAAVPQSAIPPVPYAVEMVCPLGDRGQHPGSASPTTTLRATLTITYDDGTIAFATLKGNDPAGQPLAATLTKISSMPWEWDGGATEVIGNR